MQFTINQAEIETLIKANLGTLIVVKEGSTVEIDFKAGRSDNGLTATINIFRTAEAGSVTKALEKATSPESTAVVKNQNEAATARVTTADLKRMQAEEAAAETKAESVEAEEAMQVETDQSMAEEIQAENAESLDPAPIAETAKPASLFGGMGRVKN